MGGCWSPVFFGTRMAEIFWTTVLNAASHGGRPAIDDPTRVSLWSCKAQDALRCSALRRDPRSGGNTR